MTGDKIILSIDVEDWQQSTWDRDLPISQRAADNTLRLLDILEKYGVKTTMFLLGKFSDKYMEIVRRIDEKGHEIACHGYGHIEIFKQNYKSFKLDVEKSKDSIEQIIGKPVVGYRAPDFSIMNSTLWALEVLAELEFQYDSSVFPIRHNRYGIPNWPRNIQNVILDNGKSIIEFPLSTLKIGNVNIPICGGGYFRLIPIKLLCYLVKRILINQPLIFYMHPYELDDKEFDCLEFKVPFSTRVHQGFGRKYFLKRLEILFTKYKFCTFMDIINNRSTAFPSLSISK